ncbi:MAG: hypothetical protein H6706_13875 [Myxococcales bacterium]|nr:hypothetical protein [Myxococcales bacterium]
MRRLAAGVVALGLSAARADEPLRLRLESAAGVDTNITRTEGAGATQGALLRLVLDAADELRAGALSLGLDYQAGARHFPGHDEEDGVFQVLGGRLAARATPWLVVGLLARLQDRTTREPDVPRDHARVLAGPTLDVALGDVRLGLSAHASRLVYKPDADFSADGLGAGLALDVPAGAWRLEGRLGWQALRFDGDRLAAVGATPTGAPFLVRVDGELRADTLKSATVGLRRTGDWLFGAEYTLAANSSNSFRSGFVRHVWRAFATLELPAAFLVSAQLDLQRVVYDDPQFITLETFIEDENRSSGKLRVERPLAGRWSGVMHLGAWLSPFGGGPAFSRQTALLGVACHLED